jgi:hypothetical protein
LTTARKVVLIVALAALLVIGRNYVVTGGHSGQGEGWFAYAPNTGVVFGADEGLGPAAASLVWGAVVLAWAAISLWLLGSNDEPREDR